MKTYRVTIFCEDIQVMTYEIDAKSAENARARHVRAWGENEPGYRFEIEEIKRDERIG